MFLEMRATALQTSEKERRSLSSCDLITSAIIVDGNCALLGYYAARFGNFLPTFRDNLSGPIFRD
jgi:hypothetical protein